MKKNLLILAIMGLLFAFCCPKPHALVIGGAGHYYLQNGDIHQPGGGWAISIGENIGSNLIGWIKRYEFTTSGSHVVEGDLGTTFFTDQIVPKLKMGASADLGVGGGQVNADEPDWSFLAGLGVFCKLSSVTRLTLGVHWSNTGTLNTVSVQGGFTLDVVPAVK
jgi:hypothetical protein